MRKLEKISLDDFELKLEKAYALYDDLSASPDLENDEPGLALLADLEAEVASLTATPTFSQQVMETIYLSLGTDRQGRSIFIRAVFSIKVAVQIGVVTAMISVAIGSVLGALAGFFGGWVDHAVIWLYSTFSSIPNLVLLVVLAYVFSSINVEIFGKAIGQTLIPVYVAFCCTFWIGPCRVIRGCLLYTSDAADE